MKKFKEGQAVEVLHLGQKYSAIYVAEDSINSLHIVRAGSALRAMKDIFVNEIPKDEYMPQAGDIIYGTHEGRLQTFTIISADSTDWMVLDVYTVIREGKIIYTKEGDICKVGINKSLEIPGFVAHKPIRQEELAMPVYLVGII